MKEPKISDYEMVNPDDAYMFGGNQATHAIWSYVKYAADDAEGDARKTLLKLARDIAKGKVFEK